jgi:hypothetical protein
VVTVVVSSSVYGDTCGIVRKIKPDRVLIEMNYAPPLGTSVTLHFQHVRDIYEIEVMDEIVARAEVTSYRFMDKTGSARLVLMRFVEFVDNGEPVAFHRMQ